MQLCIFIFTKLISLCKLRSILLNKKQNISFINKSNVEKMITITIVQYLKTILNKCSLLFYKAICQGLASFKTYSSVTKTTRHWRACECYSQSWIYNLFYTYIRFYIFKCFRFLYSFCCGIRKHGMDRTGDRNTSSIFPYRNCSSIFIKWICKFQNR